MDIVKEFKDQIPEVALGFLVGSKEVKEELLGTLSIVQNSESQREANEVDRVDSEAQRKTNELAREEAESVRANAESVRANAESQREANEVDRVDSEAQRKTNELAREEAESVRANAESQREANEVDRVNSESQREANEVDRVDSEAQRKTNELAREEAESVRANAESQREANEVDRVDSEAQRKTNELAREEAEESRRKLLDRFGGVATPSTNPGTPKVNTFYIATEAGTYANMGGVVLNASEFAVIAWDGTVWSKHTIFDVLSLPDAEGADLQSLASIVVDGNQLKQVKLASMFSYNEEEAAYGVEWNVTVSSTAMTRIGNMSLHRSLPIHKKMKGCLLDDDGNVVEYLPEDDWAGATLDGSKGQVMVEIPMHYRKFETIGDIRRCWISEYPVSGYHKVPKMYISAYEATVQRSTSKLASVQNTTADYRGGNNGSSYDGTYRTYLGRPASNISRTSARSYARNRKPATSEWNCLTYDVYRTLVWLYHVEYANRNCQLAVTSEKDGNGCKQGGLGNGVTTLTDSEWSSLNSQSPFVPCGVTNSLGNGSGEVAHDVKQEDDSILKSVYANRYRGVENPFGHIWAWVDGINVRVNPSSANGGDDTSIAYFANSPSEYADSIDEGQEARGSFARNSGFVKKASFGDEGDIITSEIGGGSTSYWADSFYTNIPSASAVRAVAFGGIARHGASAGLLCSITNNKATDGAGNFGTRLCFIPEK